MVFGLANGTMIANPALAMSHLISNSESGERSESATLIATNASPQITLRKPRSA